MLVAVITLLLTSRIRVPSVSIGRLLLTLLVRNARSLYLDSSSVGAYYISLRAIGLSVRCFKDSYVASPESSNLVDTQAWVEGKDFETITISNPENSNE